MAQPGAPPAAPAGGWNNKSLISQKKSDHVGLTQANRPPRKPGRFNIVSAFVRLRELATSHGDLAKRLTKREKKTEGIAIAHDTVSRNTRAQLKQVFDALRELMTSPDLPKRPIGFVTPEDKDSKKTSATKLKT